MTCHANFSPPQNRSPGPKLAAEYGPPRPFLAAKYGPPKQNTVPGGGGGGGGTVFGTAKYSPPYICNDRNKGQLTLTIMLGGGGGGGG